MHEQHPLRKKLFEKARILVIYLAITTTTSNLTIQYSFESILKYYTSRV
jgi:hypothetical protein